jgi:hypothetical protein
MVEADSQFLAVFHAAAGGEPDDRTDEGCQGFNFRFC